MTTITKTVERALPNGDFLRVTAELRTGDTTFSDGFAVTADLWEHRGNRSGRSRMNAGAEADAGGMMHDDVLKAFPNLHPLVTVHGADPSGIPMHAIANGWYFYSGQARQYDESHNDKWANREGLTDHQRGAQALHTPPQDVPEGMDKAGFEAFAESLRDRWAAQATTARELLESLPTT